MIYSKIYEKSMRKTQEQKIKQVLEKIEPQGKILDVGSGFGVLEYFVNAVALDINENYLRKIKSKYKVKGSGDELPFKDEMFDFVFCIDTAHLLKNHQEMKRVLKKGGKLVISVFCYKQNFEERAGWLRKVVEDMQMKAEKEFIVKTEREWDFVIVAIN